ncbi:hypothetical protein Tcan_04731 [Toxocara canis]|uniref:G-protein coupled receptors family 1 profile domain-containing protein n=1 Tax=Toxocara canis TaxID=6265 RepID=A0A0B2VBI9_TOXCA|nr:hypothetical protein Tcan_04731 [Toxocara canis]
MDISVWTVVSIGFTAGGVPIAVFNAVVLIGILRKKFLRNSFTMIAFMIFNGAATGVCMVAVGSFRIVGHLRYSNYMDDLVSSKQCIANIIFVALLFFNLLNGAGLLVLNVDRAAAVVMPIFYFHKHQLIMTVLLAVCITSCGLLVFAAVITTLMLPDHYVPRICRQFDTVYFPFYVAIISTRSISAALATFVMLGVVAIMLLRRAKVLNAQPRTTDQIQLFKERQRKLTYTTILSCKITLILFVIPSLCQLYLCFTNKELLRVVSPYTMSLSFLNCVNEAFIFVIRQEGIRRSVLELMVYGTPSFLRKKILQKLACDISSPAQSMFVQNKAPLAPSNC